MKRRRAIRLVALGATAAVLLAAGISLAGTSSRDTDRNGVVAPKTANASSASGFGNLNLTVHVDKKICASGAVQCSGSGHTFAAAAPSNHNPVRLGIQVLSGATPVNGLTTSSFGISNPLVPAGTTGAVKFTTCTGCFGSASGGLYQIFVHPGGTANWKSGSYFVQVNVTAPGGTQRALVQIEI